jgi:LEA14-like dessication related protein
MFLSRRRIVLIAVIAAVAVAIILLPLILTITLPRDLSKVSIGVSKVEILNMTDNNLINLNVVFNIHNPTDTTLTTSGIDYQLFANGSPIGQGSLSFADIPVNGRPQLLSGSTIAIQSQLPIVNSHSNSQIFKTIQNSSLFKQIKWRVDGSTDLESGFSSAAKQFSATIPTNSS